MIEPQFTLKEAEATADYGKFIIEPLEQGYGNTVGNSLRRVLLTSLPGAATTVVKIQGVQHRFSTLAGLKEDIIELILNIKKLRLKIETTDDEEVVLRLRKQGPGKVYAKDIEVTAGVTIINPDLYLGTLADKKAKLEMELRARTGYGYETADEKNIETLGYIPVDSLFTPITRVNFTVEDTRVGRMTNLDKLVLDVWTDGTIAPRVAVEQAAKLLVSYFSRLYQTPEQVKKETAATDATQELFSAGIDELDIPTRIVNALENGGITTVEQLMTSKREDLVSIKNLGTKSFALLEEKLAEKGITLPE